MKKSNVILTVVLAAVSAFLLWMWHWLGFNEVDAPLDMVVSVVWWALIAGGVALVYRSEQKRRRQVRTVYLADGRYYNSESGLRTVQALSNVTFEVEDESVATGVNIKKTGPVQVVPGQPIQYSMSGIGNTSAVQLQSFYWRDTLPGQVTLTRIVTGTYNQQLSYKIVYKTNLSGDTYRTLADNLSTTKNYVLDASPTALGLAANEKVTEFMVVFGVVKAGFAQVETPYINGTVSKGLANGSSFVNVADIGGLYNGQWIMGVSRWVTSVYAKTTVTLPRTGY